MYKDYRGTIKNRLYAITSKKMQLAKDQNAPLIFFTRKEARQYKEDHHLTNHFLIRLDDLSFTVL